MVEPDTSHVFWPPLYDIALLWPEEIMHINRNAPISSLYVVFFCLNTFGAILMSLNDYHLFFT